MEQSHNHIKYLCNNNDSVALLKESSHQDHIEYGMTCINLYLGHSNSIQDPLQFCCIGCLWASFD